MYINISIAIDIVTSIGVYVKIVDPTADSYCVMFSVHVHVTCIITKTPVYSNKLTCSH